MGLKEHQGALGKGKRLEWVPNQSPVPEALAEVGAERETRFNQRPQVRLKCHQAGAQMALRGQEAITARMSVVCSHPRLATWLKPSGGR